MFICFTFIYYGFTWYSDFRRVCSRDYVCYLTTVSFSIYLFTSLQSHFRHNYLHHQCPNSGDLFVHMTITVMVYLLTWLQYHFHCVRSSDYHLTLGEIFISFTLLTYRVIISLPSYITSHIALYNIISEILLYFVNFKP